MANTVSDTLKNTLRAKQYVRWWISAAILSGVLGCLFLREIPFVAGISRNFVSFTEFWHIFGWYWVCLLLALIAHVGLLIWGPGMRTQWFAITKNPSKWMISVGNLVGVILPLICGETIILNDQELNVNSFISASFFTLNVLCIYIAFLPAYDYQSVHIAVGIWASIICFVAKDIRVPWCRAGVYLIGALLIFVFLMFHHWVTSETTQQATTEVLSNDPRAGNEDILYDPQADNRTRKKSRNLFRSKT